MCLLVLSRTDVTKSPAEKVHCIVKSAKLLFKSLRHVEAGADEYFPYMVFLIVRTKIVNLYANIQYIQRFRHPARLEGEVNYHLTNLVSLSP